MLTIVYENSVIVEVFHWYTRHCHLPLSLKGLLHNTRLKTALYLTNYGSCGDACAITILVTEAAHAGGV